MALISFPSGRTVPSWSWMAYDGELKFMDIPFGGVEWSSNVRWWSAAEKQKQSSELVAPAETQIAELEGLCVIIGRKIAGAPPSDEVMPSDEGVSGDEGASDCGEAPSGGILRDAEKESSSDQEYYVLLVQPVTCWQLRICSLGQTSPRMIQKSLEVRERCWRESSYEPVSLEAQSGTTAQTHSCHCSATRTGQCAWKEAAKLEGYHDNHQQRLCGQPDGLRQAVEVVAAEPTRNNGGDTRLSNRVNGSLVPAERQQQHPSREPSAVPSHNEAGSRTNDNGLDDTDPAEVGETKQRPTKRKRPSSSHDGPARKKRRRRY
ncbi:hypothetical protein B0O99DRAFT_600684 [Bisporella sp. PMI_857]|nr:hypothetical protein B0O99DRAFT_600684 [Bisporella sp. PMI_857]